MLGYFPFLFLIVFQCQDCVSFIDSVFGWINLLSSRFAFSSCPLHPQPPPHTHTLFFAFYLFSICSFTFSLFVRLSCRCSIFVSFSHALYTFLTLSSALPHYLSLSLSLPPVFPFLCYLPSPPTSLSLLSFLSLFLLNWFTLIIYPI